MLDHPRALRRVRGLLAPALAGAAAAWSAGCGQCDGVLGCSQSPRLGVSGEIIDRNIPGGPPVAGVRVEIIRNSGVQLAASPVAATTDGSGWWTVSVGADAVGPIDVDVLVTPPAPDRPYRVPHLQLGTSVTRGDGRELGRWSPRPYISYVGRLIDATTNQPIEGAKVTVVRRGGVEVTATSATDTSLVTNGDGAFLYDVAPAALATLYVDFLVDRPGFPRITIANAPVVPGYEWVPPHAYATTTFYLDANGGVRTGAGQPATRAPGSAGARVGAASNR